MFPLDWESPSSVTLAVVACVIAALWWHSKRNRREPTAAELSARVCEDPEILAQLEHVRSKYSLSLRGFLPALVCERLPPAYEAWEALVSELPRLNRQGALRSAVDGLPELEMGDLDDEGEVRRAYLLLGMLAHSYVHGPVVPWHELEPTETRQEPEPTDPQKKAPESALPPQLGKPWFAVCSLLRMPPVLTAGAVDLWNWRLRDPDGAFVPENLELTVSMTGTASELNFHMVPCSMQAAAGRVLPKLFLADALLRGGRDMELVALLRELTDVLREFKELFGKVPGGVDRDTFYNVYRPLLNGFFPEGLTLRGLDPASAKAAAPFLALDAVEEGVCVKPKGPSAGQSTMLLLFDHFLGVKHGPMGGSFQEEMLGYMPEAHRRMVHDFRQKWPRNDELRQRIRKTGNRVLAAAFDECVHALRDFRRFHLTTVQRYLARTNTGTGASTWRRLLLSTLVDTQAASTAGWGSVAEALQGQLPSVENGEEPKVDAGQEPSLPCEEATVAGRRVLRETPSPEHVPETLRASLGYPKIWNFLRLRWTINSHRPGEHFGLLFPHTVSQLESFGAAWLTQAFHAAGTLPADNEVVRIVNVREFKGGGAAAKAVITVEYAKPAAELHKELFVKMSLSSSEKNRLFCLFLAMEGKECLFNRFYAHCVPFFVPKFYFADLSMVTTNWILISETLPFADESLRGQRLAPFELEPPPIKGMDWSMPDMADKYYALFRKAAMLTAWGHSGKLGSRIGEWFPKPKPGKAGAVSVGAVAGWLYPLLEEFVLSVGARLFPADVSDPAYLAKFKAELFDIGPAVPWMHYFVFADQSLYGLMHINLHVDNGFFWRDEEGRQDCGLLDWGGVGVGFLPSYFCGPGGALSLATHEMRIGHMGGLVRRFVDTLAEFGGPTISADGLLVRVSLMDMMMLLGAIATIKQGGFGGIYEQLPREKWRDVTGLEDNVFTNDSIQALMLRCPVVSLREGLLTWKGRKYHEVFLKWKRDCEWALLTGMHPGK